MLMQIQGREIVHPFTLDIDLVLVHMLIHGMHSYRHAHRAVTVTTIGTSADTPAMSAEADRTCTSTNHTTSTWEIKYANTLTPAIIGMANLAIIISEVLVTGVTFDAVIAVVAIHAMATDFTQCRHTVYASMFIDVSLHVTLASPSRPRLTYVVHIFDIVSTIVTGNNTASVIMASIAIAHSTALIVFTTSTVSTAHIYCP